MDKKEIDKILDEVAQNVIDKINNSDNVNVGDLLKEATREFHDRMKPNITPEMQERKQQGMQRTRDTLQMILNEYNGEETLVIGRIVHTEPGQPSKCLGLGQGDRMSILELIDNIMANAGLTIEHLHIAKKVGLFERSGGRKEVYDWDARSDK